MAYASAWAKSSSQLVVVLRFSHRPPVSIEEKLVNFHRWILDGMDTRMLLVKDKLDSIEPIVGAISNVLPQNPSGPFLVIIDYKGMRRPPLNRRGMEVGL